MQRIEILQLKNIDGRISKVDSRKSSMHNQREFNYILAISRNITLFVAHIDLTVNP